MINVCFITDENYVLPTLVAMKSLIVNSKNEITINIVSTALSDESQKLFLQLATEKVKVNIIFTKNPLENIDVSHEYISKEAFLKLTLPNLFKDLDKILYIDGDTLIVNDLQELYDTDLEDNYAGVILDVNVCKIETHYKDEGLTKYFNAGVMLLNLSKIRNENLFDDVDKYINNKKYQRYMEQDTLNFLFREKVKWLPLKYNFFSPVYNFDFVAPYLNISEEEYQNLENSIAIYHYAGVIINRINKMLPEKDFLMWYKYFCMLPDSNLKLYKALNFCIQYQINQNNIFTELKNDIFNLQQENIKTNLYLEKLSSENTILNSRLENLSNENTIIKSDFDKLLRENEIIKSDLSSLLCENNLIKSDLSRLISATSILICNKQTFLQKIFSVKNCNAHKIITVLGIKIKIKRKIY